MPGSGLSADSAGAPEAFLSLFGEMVKKLYAKLVDNPDYTRIINRNHYERLAACVSDARQKGAAIHQINPANEVSNGNNQVFLPTIIFDVNDNMAVMQEEIFGPILPVIAYRTLDDAVAYVNAHPRPLALNYFDENSARVDHVLELTISGGVTINDVLFHILQHNLPFGGVGPSGMGHYHGFAGFEAFSKKKGVFLQSRRHCLTRLIENMRPDGTSDAVAGERTVCWRAREVETNPAAEWLARWVVNESAPVCRSNSVLAAARFFALSMMAFGRFRLRHSFLRARIRSSDALAAPTAKLSLPPRPPRSIPPK